MVAGGYNKNVAAQIWGYLKNNHFTDVGCAGIIGNWCVESALNPAAVQTPPNPPIGGEQLNNGFGLGQWTNTSQTGSGRATTMREYVNDNYKTWTSLVGQMDFFYKVEGKIPYYAQFINRMKNYSGTVSDATTYFLNTWEGNPGAGLADRIYWASKAYNDFKGTNGNNPGSGGNGNNQQIALWLFKEPIYLTQMPTPWAFTTHVGKYAYDCAIQGGTHVPYYAPCDVKCINVSNFTNSNAVHWESVNEVIIPVDNSSHYINFACLHDDNPIHKIGDIVKQGELLGHTGQAGIGITGDHMHLEIALGKAIKGEVVDIPMALRSMFGHVNTSLYPDYTGGSDASLSKGWVRNPGWFGQGKPLFGGAMYANDVFWLDDNVFTKKDGIGFSGAFSDPGHPTPSDKELLFKTASTAPDGGGHDNKPVPPKPASVKHGNNLLRKLYSTIFKF